jgi:hypothetical protein
MRQQSSKVEEIQMTAVKGLAVTTCLGLASMVFAPLASADTWNKKTILTVNEPISVPGKVLQPGKYVMKLMDSPSNRHVVQIFNEREDQLQTTILAIPNYRLRPTGKTEFQWWETPAGQPKALRAWFYPGDNFGQEFAYPKSMAVQIAQTTTERVPTTAAETAAELTTARVATVDRAGTEAELDRQTYRPTEVAQATPPPVTERQVTPAPAEPTPAPATERLPRTASGFPTVGLAGLLALGAALSLRALDKRSL